ncbi:UNVERIFIED_CONTAM: hypothetical protein Slati_0886600 [Sesamum latifolium]|uniref:CCHC-type domain-containing protein n=1 Tax=Sesamum latifolium TaxID=2727402 RepID=A0AAW2XQQ3_9LAMI
MVNGDNIAAAFNKSSRKTLSYVVPMIQNEEIIVQPTLEMSRDDARHWASTAVGYFLGRKPYFHHLNEFVRSTWPAVMEVTATLHGFYFFKFKTVAAMEEVPVWVRLKQLPVEFWTDEGLSTVASGIGRPLYQDAITRACTRLDFARVCVMLDISSTLPKHIVVLIPKEDGGEAPCRVDVEYEWLPPKCTTCNSLGHRTKECPSLHRSSKSAVQVFVPKSRPPPQHTSPSRPPAPQQCLILPLCRLRNSRCR